MQEDILPKESAQLYQELRKLWGASQGFDTQARPDQPRLRYLIG